MRAYLKITPILVVCASLMASGASAASDKAFLKKAMKGDNSEMKLGQMAAEKGAAPGVRDFGAMLNTDHAKAKPDALPVAEAHGLAPTDEMAPEAKVEAVKLSRLSGTAFDHEFATYMVSDHKKDISDFETQSKIGDQSTAALARKTLPTLRKHLRAAESLAR